MTAKTVITRNKPYAEVGFFLKRHGGFRAVLREITPSRGFFNTIGIERVNGINFREDKFSRAEKNHISRGLIFANLPISKISRGQIFANREFSEFLRGLLFTNQAFFQISLGFINENQRYW